MSWIFSIAGVSKKWPFKPGQAGEGRLPAAPSIIFHPGGNQLAGFAQFLVKLRAFWLDAIQECMKIRGVIHENRVTQLMQKDTAHPFALEEKQFIVQRYRPF